MFWLLAETTKPASTNPLQFFGNMPLLTFLVGTLAGTLITWWYKSKELRLEAETLAESQNQRERQDIRHRLNHFYGPFRALRVESRHLYNCFALDIKKTDPSFRTLRHLADGLPLDPPDREILAQILKIGGQQLTLIEKEGWAVANSDLSALLGRLAAHIRILTLAGEGKIVGRAETVEDMVFPLEIDGAIATETRKLHKEYRLLLKAGAGDRKTRRDLEFRISTDSDLAPTPEQRRTIKTYGRTARSYYKETAYLDLSDTKTCGLPMPMGATPR